MAPYLFVPDEERGNRFLRKAAGDGRPTVTKGMVGRASVPADPHACILCGRALHVKREAVFRPKKNHRRVWTGGPKGGAKQAVSRVLSRVAPVMIIPLGPRLPGASSNLPGSFGRATLKRSPIWSCSRWGFPSRQCRHCRW